MSFIVQIGVSELVGAAILEETAPLSGCAGFFCITPFTLMYLGTEPAGGAVGNVGAATGGDAGVGAAIGSDALVCDGGVAAAGFSYAGFFCITPFTCCMLRIYHMLRCCIMASRR